MNRGMRVLQTLALPLGYVTVWKKEQSICSFSFVERATRKAPLRRLRRMKRGAFEEAARSAHTQKVGVDRIAATVSAETPVK